MTQQQAIALSTVIGGTPTDAGGNHWLVIFHHDNGRVVAMSDIDVCLYPSEEAFSYGVMERSISFATS